MKILVCGPRLFRDRHAFEAGMANAMFQLGFPTVEIIIHGAARGVDAMAGDWAWERGIPVAAYPADWDKYGKAAGSIRNKQMVDEGKPDVVIAFNGDTPGTRHMMITASHSFKRVIAIPIG